MTKKKNWKDWKDMENYQKTVLWSEKWAAVLWQMLSKLFILDFGIFKCFCLDNFIVFSSMANRTTGVNISFANDVCRVAEGQICNPEKDPIASF